MAGFSTAPIVKGFYDGRTFSIRYVASCPATGRCAIIDPVLDFDEKSGAVVAHSADAILAHVAGARPERAVDSRYPS